MINLKSEIFKLTNKFITQINDLCSESKTKIDEKLTEYIKLSEKQTNLNFNEYKKYLSSFEMKIKTKLVQIDEPKKYYSQVFFKEISKNLIELKHKFEYVDKVGEILKINSNNDQKLSYFYQIKYLYLT